MIEIKKGRYFKAYWFVGCEDRDLLAAMFRDPEGPWKLLYRFRYYEDDKVFDSKDRKSWTGFETKDGVGTDVVKMVACMDFVAALTEKTFNGKLYKVDLDTDDHEKIICAMSKQPWFHVREATPEEIAEYKKNKEL